MSAEQEQKMLDDRILNVLKAQQGLTFSFLLTQLSKVTAPMLTDALERLQASRAVTKASFDGIIRYYRAGYMLEETRSERGATRRREIERAIASNRLRERPVPVMERPVWKPAPGFMEPARAGSLDFLKYASKGL
jgi:hypothetical protein